MIVFIDSGILGILANPNKEGEVSECEEWLYGLLSKGIYVLTSELCDYEIRRSLVLEAKKNPQINGIKNLDELRGIITFLPITSTLLKEASVLWAEARIQGVPTADAKSLDVDIIICTQCILLTEEFPGRSIIIATTNIKHLSRFASARNWRNIKV
ncbi:type II toxin-antitoxin system VapC family toxin [Scytonema sp. NUACC26]|uniref:type II toxin-antitoxin system VapC family toxin n=1 Tax=Scytonema sp. NUACC26 TaxID=3140176 RepID=UPI0034DC349C